jgi:uncharacterized protein (TIGR02145 family)
MKEFLTNVVKKSASIVLTTALVWTVAVWSYSVYADKSPWDVLTAQDWNNLITKVNSIYLNLMLVSSKVWAIQSATEVYTETSLAQLEPYWCNELTRIWDQVWCAHDNKFNPDYFKDWQAYYKHETAKTACPTWFHLPTKDEFWHLIWLLGWNATIADWYARDKDNADDDDDKLNCHWVTEDYDWSEWQIVCWTANEVKENLISIWWFNIPGYYNDNGFFATNGIGYYWASTTWRSWARHMRLYSSQGLFLNIYDVNYGFQVRCLKDI